eukprot:CCRYP_017736-RA/>CCRYP_017736-RA protein AED:0.39 eAED:0.39 QI:0/-1/0/1/-1/1/1/0/801
MRDQDISIVQSPHPSADSTGDQVVGGEPTVDVMESEKIAGKEVPSLDSAGTLGLENINKRVSSREERKQELLIEARQARINWILGDVNEDAKDLKEVFNGTDNPLRDLQACTPDRFSCAPDVVEAMFSSKSNVLHRDKNVTASKIATEVKRILEHERLSWESVSCSSQFSFQSPNEQGTPGTRTTSAQLQHEHYGIPTMPPVPQAQSYKIFLQILCEPDAADIVFSMQKFCKTIEEASTVIMSVQEDERQKEMNAKSEREKKFLQQHQHPLVSSTNLKDCDPNETKDKSGDGLHVRFSVLPEEVESKKIVQPSTSQAINKHATSLAKAVRGFINKTFREMQSHGSFKVFFERYENKPEDMESDVKDELMACIEAFVFMKCHNPIYHVLGGELEALDDDHVHHNLSCFSKDKTYPSVAKTVDEVDFELMEKMTLLHFVTPEHLEIQCLKSASNSFSQSGDIVDLSYSIDHLRSIQHQPSPRQKLRSILLAHRGINASLNAVLDTMKGTTLSISPPSADDVLPTLILAVLRAQPPKIITDLRLIEFFATVSLLRGEAGYAYTNLCGAVQFLRKLDLESHAAEVSLGGLGEGAVLSISPDDFRAGIEESRKAMALIEDKMSKDTKENNDQTESSNGSEEGESSSEGTALSEVLLEMKISGRDIREARDNGETTDLNWAVRKQKDLLWQYGKVQTTLSESGHASMGNTNLPTDDPPLPPQFTRSYSYLTTRVDDVRISDLPCLLNEYRLLVHATETLLNERSSWIESEKRRQKKIARFELERNYRDVIGETSSEMANGHDKGAPR